MNLKDCYLSRKDSGLQGVDIQVANVDGEDQPGASQMSEMDTPLDHAQEEVMPLVEWALTPMGHCNPKEEYANKIASTNHLEIICFVTGPPLTQLLKPTKSCSDFLYETEHSMYTLKALTGQSRDSWLPVGGRNVERIMTWALNGVESTLGT